MTASPLLPVLDVRPADDAGGAGDVFTGPNLPHWRPRLFGGQVLGQVAVAAGRTVPEDRDLHSLHAYFLRPGDPRVPVVFAVERLRDGRSFSARRVQAVQDGVPILSGIASFQTAAEGLEHHEPAPDVPGPEDLTSDYVLLDALDHPAARQLGRGRHVELRHVEPALYTDPDPERRAGQAVWFRLDAPLPGPDLLHRAALAYASDLSVLEPVLRRHGLAWAAPGMSVASLDHAMWWHRPARADEWVLYVQESPSASGARGLSTGRMYDRAGRLIATVAQEGMVRVP
ncbi:acyl-CoA thioesterase [Kineococcus radiotolerans]|uniref:Acyl-CoA thioesterase 2 n=1 Tax=Kineococcus radiotolerans (strain ATCC BAA-149 / DSM 14245 / SRS30216) TaxID=266940 RepID=A6WDW4_KINRD|nr:acyl-CoA thioesterase II [Kineococcus radiotolerans]ABS05003.1 Palmitoyl-CoA hydrolase [Kineococcus radiotolerans SRS30216 = ATCC BAA-149]